MDNYAVKFYPAPSVNDADKCYNPEQVWKALTIHFPLDRRGSDGPTAQSKISQSLQSGKVLLCYHQKSLFLSYCCVLKHSCA